MEKIVIKKQQSLSIKYLIAFIRRFHLLLFFIVVVGCLSAGVILINKTLTDSSSEDYIPTINSGTIDQATLERIQSLHTSDQPTPSTSLPAGRVNPFAE